MWDNKMLNVEADLKCKMAKFIQAGVAVEWFSRGYRKVFRGS